MTREIRLTNPDDIAALKRSTATAHERIYVTRNPERVAQWHAKRECGPTAILRALGMGESHVFPDRRAPSLGTAIADLKRHGLHYRTKQEGPHLRVTRIEPPHPADGLV